MASSQVEDETSEAQCSSIMSFNGGLPKKFVEFEIRRRLKSLRKCMYVPSLGRIDELVTTTNFMSEQLGNIAEFMYSVGKSVMASTMDNEAKLNLTVNSTGPSKRNHRHSQSSLLEGASSDDEGIFSDSPKSVENQEQLQQLSSTNSWSTITRRKLRLIDHGATNLKTGVDGHLADDEDDEGSSGFCSDASDATSILRSSKERPRASSRYRSKLFSHEQLPNWLQNNEFIVCGHRPPSYSYKTCLRSIFQFHSETGNIWSHGLGAIGFIIYATYFFYTELIPGLDIYDQLAFVVFFAAAIGCMGMSAIYHTLACHSNKVCDVTCKLDFTGITILIFGSFFPWLYYTFYDHPVLRCLYGLLGTVSALATIKMNLSEEFAKAHYRGVRAAVYITYAMICGVLPVVHFICIYNVQKLLNECFLLRFCCMILAYVFGAFVYSIRIPEKWWPGKFDYAGQSHQIMHICVILGNLAHCWGCVGLAYRRHTEVVTEPNIESIYSIVSSLMSMTGSMFSKLVV